MTRRYAFFKKINKKKFIYSLLRKLNFYSQKTQTDFIIRMSTGTDRFQNNHC